jgi:hypothetical protein
MKGLKIQVSIIKNTPKVAKKSNIVEVKPSREEGSELSTVYMSCDNLLMSRPVVMMLKNLGKEALRSRKIIFSWSSKDILLDRIAKITDLIKIQIDNPNSR